MKSDEYELNQNRNVLLLLDNAAGHGVDLIFDKLTNITVHFLPPNRTSFFSR